MYQGKLSTAQLTSGQARSPPVHICFLEDTGPVSQGSQVLLNAHLHMDVLNEDHTSASSLEYIEQMVLG